MFHYRSCIARKTAFVTFSSSGYAGAGLSLTLFTMAIHLILAISLLVMTDGQTVAHAQTPAPAASQTQPVQETIRPYDIPAGSLSVVLARFASETGILLAATPELVQGKQSPGVRGTFSIQVALNALLKGTGLEAIRNAEGQYGLQPVANIAGTLPLMTVTGAAINSGVTEGTGSYTTDYSSFGKGQILKELPQTVTAMTHQRIQDQRLFTMGDVMAYTPGVTVQQSSDSSGKGAFYSRGFQITNILLDGNSSVVAGGSSPGGPTNTYSVGTLDMAMFDSVEVMRGSNALYGVTAGAPGGAINLVRKRPTKAFQLNAQVSGGSWDNYRGELDVSGPVALLDGRVRGRLVGTYQDGESFINYSDSNKKLFYGIVEADITSRTLLTVGGHIQRDKDGYVIRDGLPRYSNGNDLKLPRSTYLGTSNDRYKRDDNNLFIRIGQKIGADWDLSIEAVRGKYDYSIQNFNRFGLIDPITSGGMEAYAFLNDTTGTNKALDVSLKGSFHLLGREHRLTLGANYNKNDESIKTTFLDDIFEIPDIFAYDPSNYPNPYNSENIYGFYSANRYNKQKGLYGSLAMKITDPLTLIVGGRLSWYEFDYVYTFSSPSGELEDSYHSAVKDNKVFTPYLGLTYDLLEAWSVYAPVSQRPIHRSHGVLKVRCRARPSTPSPVALMK
ncbi:TonB-dependent siderophore receptor [Nitrosomonas sp.]|uniref:TonB-dependent siderophore receptor n=3 Tax=Nitrosomonas sp. TaxID=42353 RepID=UPI0037C6386E